MISIFSNAAYAHSFDARDMITFETSDALWDALGVNALDPALAQKSVLHPNRMTWSPNTLSALQRTFVRAVAAPPFYAVLGNRDFSELSVDIRTDRHLLSAYGHLQENNPKRRGGIAGFVIGSFANAKDAEFIRIEAGWTGSQLLRECLVVMQSLLQKTDIGDAGAPSVIDTATLSLKSAIRPQLSNPCRLLA